MNDIEIARKYLHKAQSSKDRGLDFTMTFTAFKNVCRAKRCYYTGIVLTNKTRSFDRIDNSLGYVKGNVVACDRDFNTFKGHIENPQNGLNMDNVIKGMNKWKNR